MASVSISLTTSEIFSRGANYACLLPHAYISHPFLIKLVTIGMLFMYYYSVIWALYANGYIAVAYWHSSFVWSIVAFNVIWYILDKWTNKMMEKLNKHTNSEQYNRFSSISTFNSELLDISQLFSAILYIVMLLIKYYYSYPGWDSFILPVFTWAALCLGLYYLNNLKYNKVRICMFI